MDVRQTNQGGTDLGSQTYSTGGISLYELNGANIPYQYKYSFLRDISGSGEAEMLIEGPVSDASTSLTIGSSNQAIKASFPSTPPSEVTKARIYRVGGDYASYYKIADVDIANNVDKYECLCILVLCIDAKKVKVY